MADYAEQEVKLHKNNERKWVKLLHPAYKGTRLYFTSSATGFGMRVEGVGIVGFHEYRLPTAEEWQLFEKSL